MRATACRSRLRCLRPRESGWSMLETRSIAQNVPLRHEFHKSFTCDSTTSLQDSQLLRRDRNLDCAANPSFARHVQRNSPAGRLDRPPWLSGLDVVGVKKVLRLRAHTSASLEAHTGALRTCGREGRDVAPAASSRASNARGRQEAWVHGSGDPSAVRARGCRASSTATATHRADSRRR